MPANLRSHKHTHTASTNRLEHSTHVRCAGWASVKNQKTQQQQKPFYTARLWLWFMPRYDVVAAVRSMQKKPGQMYEFNCRPLWCRMCISYLLHVFWHYDGAADPGIIVIESNTRRPIVVNIFILASLRLRCTHSTPHYTLHIYGILFSSILEIKYSWLMWYEDGNCNCSCRGGVGRIVEIGNQWIFRRMFTCVWSKWMLLNSKQTCQLSLYTQLFRN